MAILMPKDTRETLGADAAKCDSRSLFMDRFAKPDAKEEDRKKWFEQLISKTPVRIVRQAITSTGGRTPVYGQLQSRLMVNMAGGVMENAGLCLDRFGLPYIPGSALKGCARRMAIQLLVEAESIQAKSDLLSQIALAFGWGVQDWSSEQKEGRFKSDFAYAAGPDFWPAVSTAARKRLPNADHFAGAVSFLPANVADVSGAELPLRPPSLGALELDVVTCHHPDYYQGNMKRLVATDDEDPNPVLFPTVAAGHVLAFSVLPLRNCTDALLEQAHKWLADGLTIFGLGAKTAAGYGWFDCSEAVQAAVKQAIEKREKQEAQRRQAESDAAEKKAKDEAERIRRESEKAAMANLTPEQQEDFKVAQLKEDQFRSALDNFAKKTPEEQKALVRALRLDAGVPGSRRVFWEDLKAKAKKKGGKLAHTENSIRELSKQMFSGKEGKMP